MVKPRENLPLTAERLREVTVYDAETGHFSQNPDIVGRAGVRPGRPLGHVEPNGYRRLMIDGVRYLAHRLAWLYVHGRWPAVDIDHRNGARDDNRLANLREATRAQNQANMKVRTGTVSGLRGAQYNRFRGYWQSYIRVNGKSRSLGRFSTAEEAHKAFMEVYRAQRGEFARD